MNSALEATIAAQADLLGAALSADITPALERLEAAQRLWLVGTGTSQHAAELGAWMLRGGPREVHARSSSAFALEEPRLSAEDGVVVISHTTETAFARRARERALAAGARVVSITGIGRGWPEAVETVPAETAETYTVSYTAALVVLARLALELAQPSFTADELAGVVERVREAADAEPPLDAAPERLLVLAGMGPSAVTAREGALKLREGARLMAEGFEAEYLLHGCAVPLRAGDALLAVRAAPDPSGLLDGLMQAAAAEGLATFEVAEPAGLPDLLAQIPLTVRLQVLAARMAAQRGEDPDRVILGAWADQGLWEAGAPE